MANSARRRTRSTRVLIAFVLVLVGALLVAGAAVSGAWLPMVIAAAAGVLLGIIATRLTYLEMLDTRRAAAADRAKQAQDYRSLAERRADDNAAFVGEMQGRSAKQRATISRLESRLEAATASVIEARGDLGIERERVATVEARNEELSLHLDEARNRATGLTARVDDAEERAALAVVSVAELEQEIDVLTAELHTARLHASQAGRRRA